MRHGFRRRGRFIEQRCVGDLHAGQIADHSLKIQQAFQPALRHFGLIRRVRRVPAGIFQHIAQDHAGRDAIGIAQAEIGFENLIARGECAQLAQKLIFALAVAARLKRLGQAECAAGIASSMSASSDAAPVGFQHRIAFGCIRTNMAGGERLEVKDHSINSF